MKPDFLNSTKRLKIGTVASVIALLGIVGTSSASVMPPPPAANQAIAQAETAAPQLVLTLATPTTQAMKGHVSHVSHSSHSSHSSHYSGN